MKAAFQFIFTAVIFTLLISVGLWTFDEYPLLALAAIGCAACYGIGLQHGRREASKRLD